MNQNDNINYLYQLNKLLSINKHTPVFSQDVFIKKNVTKGYIDQMTIYSISTHKETTGYV